jgi:3'-phosphoadenosine 5'-phosphosulfate sulfotransferase (PAPS reductase)/FAD synthetase
MSTRSNTQRSVNPSNVLKRLPSRFREHVNANILGKLPVDLMVFEAGKDTIVTLKNLQKAIDSRGESTLKLVVVGHDFTDEVRDTVDAMGGLVFSVQNFGWTKRD